MLTETIYILTIKIVFYFNYNVNLFKILEILYKILK